jgi:hypothetical protein
MSLSLGSAKGVDLRRPIGRLDWVVGFSSEPDRLLTVFSPIVACVPVVEDPCDTLYAKTVRHQTTQNAAAERTKRLRLGALYYLDTLTSIGREAALFDGDLALLPHAYVGTAKAYFESCTVTPKSSIRFIQGSEDCETRLRQTLELHARVAPGMWFCHAIVNQDLQILIPCSELVFLLYQSLFTSLHDVAARESCQSCADSRSLFARALVLAQVTGIRSFLASDVAASLSEHTILCGEAIKRCDNFGSIYLFTKLLNGRPRDKRLCERCSRNETALKQPRVPRKTLACGD